MANQRLKEVRTDNKLTQEEFASKLNLKQAKIRDIEYGKQKVSVEIASDIEDEFNINMRWLLSGRGDKYLNKNNVTINVPDVIDAHIASKEIELINAYRELEKDNQEIFYYEVLAASAKDRKKRKELSQDSLEDAKSAV